VLVSQFAWCNTAPKGFSIEIGGSTDIDFRPWTCSSERLAAFFRIFVFILILHRFDEIIYLH
jgi:hypothetical protein